MGLAGVAYTATVAQAHALAEELAARGVRAAAVSGQTPGRELQRVLDFASERIDVLCNADLLTEGWDETRASVVMHLAPTTSERVFVQRLGRVMRPAPDKEAVSVGPCRSATRWACRPATTSSARLVQPLAGWPGRPRPASAEARAGRAAPGGPERRLRQVGQPAAAPGLIAAGLADGGWRDADPALLPVTLMEERVEAAAHDVTVDELIELVTAGVDPLAAVPWWALSGLVARRLHDGADQPLWRAWATALLVQPDLRRALPDDVPRRVLDRLRMTSRSGCGPCGGTPTSPGAGSASPPWSSSGGPATAAAAGRRSTRPRPGRRAGPDVSRALADNARPGRNQEVARIAAWEAHHLISNGGDLALIGISPAPPASRRPSRSRPTTRAPFAWARPLGCW